MGGDWQKFLDWRYRHINSLVKVHYVLAHDVARMMNFR
jgi:hypothetical protein